MRNSDAGCGVRCCAVVAAVVVAVAMASATSAAEMRLIPGGEFRPLYGDGAAVDGDSGAIRLADFHLDAKAVSNGDFLNFVRAHPKWRKSRVKRIFADPNYLAHWRGDFALVSMESAAAPVVHVSWFAAQAFCRARGGALPTTAQWEYAAAASETAADASHDPAFIARILAWYSLPGADGNRDDADSRAPFQNFYGIQDLHGARWKWEWVLDFNTALTSGESRADSSRDRQLYCAAGVVGATNYEDYPSFLRYGYRSSLTGRYTHRQLGFRCAAAVEVES